MPSFSHTGNHGVSYFIPRYSILMQVISMMTLSGLLPPRLINAVWYNVQLWKCEKAEWEKAEKYKRVTHKNQAWNWIMCQLLLRMHAWFPWINHSDDQYRAERRIWCCSLCCDCWLSMISPKTWLDYILILLESFILLESYLAVSSSSGKSSSSSSIP